MRYRFGVETNDLDSLVESEEKVRNLKGFIVFGNGCEVCCVGLQAEHLALIPGIPESIQQLESIVSPCTLEQLVLRVRHFLT